jgi:hypothetical protein
MPKPSIPEWISGYTPPSGWTNVFQLVSSNKNLYGTETLFGDWNGRTLLLAKDGAPTDVIRALRDKGEPQPWRHAQKALGDTGGWRTNETLERLAASVPGGKLYGSATANLLCDDPRWSRSLPGFFSGPMHEYLKRVLGWVLDSMPNVEQVACLGKEAWFLTCSVLGDPDAAKAFPSYRDAQKRVVGKRNGRIIAAHALYHPAARIDSDSKKAGWGALAQFGQIKHSISRIEQSISGKNHPSDPLWREVEPLMTEKQPNPRGIRGEMLKLMRAAGHHGVAANKFGNLEWQTSLEGRYTPRKLRKAMGYLAYETGIPLQFKGEMSDKEFPSSCRIRPATS